MFVNRAGVQNSYQSKVKIGNWYEEQELNEIKIKDFLHRKSSGQLLINKTNNHLQSSLLPVSLSHSRDSYVHIGDHVMLYSVATDGVVSVDPSEKTGSIGTNFAATTSTLTRAPVARNTFVVEPYQTPGAKHNIESGSPLLFGQLFRLRTNPKLSQTLNAGYYLHSQPVSSVSSSKVSRKQEISFSPSLTHDSVFRALSLNIHTRFELEGSPIPANAELIVVHAQTQQALSSDTKYSHLNDFGAEYELCAHSYLDIKKSQGLYAELQGRKTTDVPFRKEQLPNHFAFLTATTTEGAIITAGPKVQTTEQKTAAVAPVVISPPAASSSSPASLINSAFSHLRDSVLSRGPFFLHHLSKSLRLLDLDQSETILNTAFRHVLNELNIEITNAEVELIEKEFKIGVDRIRYVELIIELRGGEMNLRRSTIVDKVFTTLDRDNIHSVPLSLLERAYNPHSDPGVASGSKSVEQARNEFVLQLSEYAGLGQGRVSREEFVDYYSSLSVYVEKDEEFVRKIESAWGAKE